MIRTILHRNCKYCAECQHKYKQTDYMRRMPFSDKPNGKHYANEQNYPE